MKTGFVGKLILVTLTVCLFTSHRKDHYHLIILNGTVYDGSGGKSKSVDIAVVDDSIVRIGDLANATADRVIDATGLAVSPGFIDLHAHLESIEQFPDCQNHVRQGVTTALGGPDGGGPWPFGAHLEHLRKMGIGLNAGFLVGHNTIRKNIMQLENRTPTKEELVQMQTQVSAAMEEGAFGFSTGLKYLPGAFSNTEEVIGLSKIAASYGGIYTSHLRDEGLGILDAVGEAILIGKEAKIPIVLTHHKIVGKPMWGSSRKSLALVDSARKAGIDVMLDQYPYTSSHTGISILIPSWAMEGGDGKFKERIRDKMLRDSIKNQIVFNIINDRGCGDLNRVQFLQVKWKPELNGKTLYDWCVIENLTPSMENGAELVMKAQDNGGARCMFHAMNEDDVKRIMKHPYTAVASDGSVTRPDQGYVHPRAYGTFPRVLAKYVREEKIISLQEAIRKMTSLPAKRIGISDRGILKLNFKADIVIFDPEKIQDMSTVSNPHQYPQGINYVVMNGKIVVDNGVFKNIKAGKILFGPGTKRPINAISK